MTIDGATFTLPDFGNGQPDNVAAANQTIEMNDQRGASLVFLATSTQAFVTDTDVDGLASSLVSGVYTSPTVPGDTPVTGSNCGTKDSFSSTDDSQTCSPASGVITYSDGTAASTYYLTVPDWQGGPTDIAALDLPHLNTPSGQESPEGGAKLYAFSVPLSPSSPVSSITLPDVSKVYDGGDNPALHILGVAVRNTTTATPEAGGTAAPAPTAQAWTGAWSNSTEGAFAPQSGTWNNETMRIEMTPTITGPTTRIRLSNPGSTSNTVGDSAITIGHATIATSSTAMVPTATPVNLTFGGKASVTIPEGGDIYSDPVNFAVTAGKPVLVSAWLSGTQAYLPEHTLSAPTQEWVSPPGSGDHAADNANSAITYTLTLGDQWMTATTLVTGLDVVAPTSSTSPATTIAVLGDNISEGAVFGALPTTATDSIRTEDALVPLLAQNGTYTNYGVVDDGIQSNQIATDGTSGRDGISALARLDHDVLAQPSIGTVIITEGLEDLILNSKTDDSLKPDSAPQAAATELENKLQQLTLQLNAYGISVILATLTPSSSYYSVTTGHTANATKVTLASDGTTQIPVGPELDRQTVNDWITNGDILNPWTQPSVSDADFSTALAVTDPRVAATSTPLPSGDDDAGDDTYETPAGEMINNASAPNDFNTGDYINLTSDGYKAIAATISLTDIHPNALPELP